MSSIENRQEIIDVLNKNEEIAHKIYTTLIEKGKDSYKSIFGKDDCSDFKDEYWIRAMGLYKSLNEEQQTVLFQIIRQVMVDTGATMLSILEGSTTLAGGGSFDSKIVIDGVNAEYLLDYFLSIDEENNE